MGGFGPKDKDCLAGCHVGWNPGLPFLSTRKFQLLADLRLQTSQLGGMALVASLQCDSICLSTRRITSSDDAKPDTVKLATVAKSAVHHKKGNLGSLRLARTTRNSRLEALAVQDNAGSSGASLASSEV